jgi:aminoglycoside phosphotransferase (APT) family kinase protein
VPLPPVDEWCRTRDDAVWRPHVAAVLRSHGLPDAEPVAGYNPTNPTYVCGDAVVKVFCGPRAADRQAGECAALTAVAADPGIPAPRLLGSGSLAGGWPYLVMSRVPGAPVTEPTEALARELGGVVRRLHALPTAGLPRDVDWPPGDVGAALAHSRLPAHLAAQAPAYVDRWLGEPDRVLAHGDLCAMHVFVDGGRISGLLDWGDALVTDRHYELVQPYRDLFGCDRALFRTFLAAASWPTGADFPHRALAHALRRQAVGMTQHWTIDVFWDPADVFPLAEVATLEDLAELMFG